MSDIMRMQRTPLSEAANWFVRLQSKRVSQRVRVAFTEWILISPDNVTAYLEITNTFEAVRDWDSTDSCAALPSAAQKNAGAIIKLDSPSSSGRVVLPPGFLINRLSKFFLTRAAHRMFVMPVIADMQDEYFGAIVAGEPRHARWIVIRGHLLVIPMWIYAAVARLISGLLSK